MNNITIRRFKEKDAEVVSKIICRNLREVNIKDYEQIAMEELCLMNSPKILIENAGKRHIYIAESDDKIVGTGSIGWVADKVSMIYSVFILPERQGIGIGKSILSVLENDEIFLGSKLVKVCASITAIDFYLNAGYLHEYGQAKLVDDDFYPVVKKRKT